MSTKLLTNKQKRMLGYNDVITKNKPRFKAGKRFTRKQFIKLLKLSHIVDGSNAAEIMRNNLNLVNAQTEVNKLMRENGLYISSKNYYSEFSVSSIEEVKGTVLRYSSEVDINRSCTTRLETCLKTRVETNSWGSYKRVKHNRVLSLANEKPSASPRHERTVQRMADL